eukprot:4858389-Prymnesium_polylepis.3
MQCDDGTPPAALHVPKEQETPMSDDEPGGIYAGIGYPFLATDDYLSDDEGDAGDAHELDDEGNGEDDNEENDDDDDRSECSQ